MKYEYREVQIVMGDMRQLNELGAEGWRVVMLLPSYSLVCLLLEREIAAPSKMDVFAELAYHGVTGQ